MTNAHTSNANSNTDASIERKAGGAAGNCIDSNSSTADFLTPVTPSTPQSSASPPTP